MWRIYSQDKRTEYDHCIGKVEYLKKEHLIDRAKATFSKTGEITFGGLFRSLLIKRRAFKHENEIRIIFQRF
jgi:hypothetical protein